ncbi:hypothetical protein [Castellaniella ginsengisoli]|uniref:Uncharacterized protein n=1 Tax=Castellaniella ginsengisoli TaxID=546114 RepID=A0AB39D7A5_9BURK
MAEIVNYVIGAGRPRQERDAARKAVARVLAAMEDSGSLLKTPSEHVVGGYALYRLRIFDGGGAVLKAAEKGGTGHVVGLAHPAKTLKDRRHQKLADLISEAERLPPPQYTYEQVIAMLRLGIPFELRAKAEAVVGR